MGGIAAREVNASTAEPPDGCSTSSAGGFDGARPARWVGAALILAGSVASIQDDAFQPRQTQDPWRSRRSPSRSRPAVARSPDDLRPVSASFVERRSLAICRKRCKCSALVSGRGRSASHTNRRCAPGNCRRNRLSSIASPIWENGHSSQRRKIANALIIAMMSAAPWIHPELRPQSQPRDASSCRPIN